MPRIPRSTRWLKRRDAKRDIGRELLESIRQIKAGVIGAVHLVPVPERVQGASKGILARVAADPRPAENDHVTTGAAIPSRSCSPNVTLPPRAQRTNGCG